MSSLTQPASVADAVSTETDILYTPETLDTPDVPSASDASDSRDRFVPPSTMGEPPGGATEPSGDGAPGPRPALWLGVDALIRIGHD